MADTKEFDVDQIKGSQYMDRKDRQYFERYGAAMSDQAEILAEQYEIDPKEMNDTFDTLMETLFHNWKEYIVKGAPLKCSMQAEEGTEQTLYYKGSEMTSKPILTADMSALRLPEDRHAEAGGLIFANVSDTEGGLGGELVAEEGKLNIASFGNCKRIDEDNITDIEEMVKDVCRALMDRYEYTGVTDEDVLNEMLKAIEQNKGTCFCCMVLNPEWENLPVEYDYVDNTFREEPMMAGIDRVLFSDSYMQFNGKEGINMMSMLFCRYGGGIISAKESGQKIKAVDDVFTELERILFNKFGSELQYQNWAPEKRKCAEEIWQRFYVEAGYDACFVAGLIGNMFAEGQCGLLQGIDGWEQFGNLTKLAAISNIEQANAACLKAPNGYGIGMMQWSFPTRKATLFQCYQKYQSDDGTLSKEQLIKAEIDMMFVELADEKNQCGKIIPIYDKHAQKDNTSDNITFSTCLLFREYEAPETRWDVDADS